MKIELHNTFQMHFYNKNGEMVRNILAHHDRNHEEADACLSMKV